MGCGVESIGTAFAIDDRLLVTNRHVTEIDATPQLVSRDGSRRLDAMVVGWSQDPDLAVLEVRQFVAPTLAWADSAGLTEGELLVAFGYPTPGHDFAVTPTRIRSFVTDGALRHAIRTDGRFDTGNSGGPALTEEGRVAGVVAAFAGSEGDQLVPMLTTHDHLRPTLEALVRARPGVEVRCEDLDPRSHVADGWAGPS